MHDFLRAGRLDRGLEFPSFLRLLEGALPNAPLNYRRMTRILRTYEVPADVRDTLISLDAPQIWMVLSEPWCGDSAQSLPIIAKFAGCAPKVTLRILPRDENLDIMDLYRTAGTRGIPKLVAFGQEGDELFQWGPRPAGAQEEFLRAKREGLEKAEALERVHRWYAKDCGRSIQEEIAALVRGRPGRVRPGPPGAEPVDRPLAH